MWCYTIRWSCDARTMIVSFFFYNIIVLCLECYGVKSLKSFNKINKTKKIKIKFKKKKRKKSKF